MIIQVWSLVNIWILEKNNDIVCIICGKKLDKNKKNFFISYDFYCDDCKNNLFGDNKK